MILINSLTGRVIYRAIAPGILSLMAVFSGCKQEGPAEQAGKNIDEAMTKASDALEQTRTRIDGKSVSTKEYISDSELTAKIKGMILSDPLLNSKQINVTTTNGSVELSGVVDSQQSIDRALEIARSDTRVNRVVNHLVVK
jgi:hyperosmotically inducible protein